MANKTPEVKKSPVAPPKPEPKQSGPDTMTVTAQLDTLLAMYREATGKADATIDSMLGDHKAVLNVKVAAKKEAAERQAKVKAEREAIEAKIAEFKPSLLEFIKEALSDFLPQLVEVKAKSLVIALTADGIGDLTISTAMPTVKATPTSVGASGERRSYVSVATGALVDSKDLTAKYPEFAAELDQAYQAADRNNAVARVRAKLIKHDQAQGALALGKYIPKV